MSSIFCKANHKSIDVCIFHPTQLQSAQYYFLPAGQRFGLCPPIPEKASKGV
jgi:hypothetical protein